MLAHLVLHNIVRKTDDKMESKQAFLFIKDKAVVSHMLKINLHSSLYEISLFIGQLQKMYFVANI